MAELTTCERLGEPAAERAASVVLLVDDEESVRDVAGRLLALWGYEVLIADGPRRALSLAADPGITIDLLMTDLSMPHMNGLELAAALRVARPELRVLVTSGYDRGSAVGDGVETDVRFLAKPYNSAALRRAVAEALVV